jgi:drug/metabolite transporter (DMT)-like permease
MRAMTSTSPVLPASGRLPGGVLLTLAMITVGSTVVASRIIAAGLPPFTAAALRFAIAAPIFLALMHWRGERLPRPSRRDLLLIVLQALCGSVGYGVLMVAGLRTTSAASAGVITGCLPAVGALLGALVLRERLGARLVGGIALACVGVAAVVVMPHRAQAAAPSSGIGNALVLAAVGCEAVFLLLNKQLRVPLSPLALSTFMAGLGLAMTLGPALAEHAWTSPPARAALLGVLYYALVPTVGGYLLWYAGAERMEAGRAALYTAVLPVAALLLAGAVLHEPIGARQLVGAACVLAAIAASAAPRQRDARQRTDRRMIWRCRQPPHA